MCLVHETIEDGVGISRIADDIVPFVDRQLAGDDSGAAPEALLDQFQEIVACASVEWFKPPIIKHQEIDPAQRAHQARIASITASQGQFGKQFWDALVEH